jgi:hypothetical protein
MVLALSVSSFPANSGAIDAKENKIAAKVKK